MKIKVTEKKGKKGKKILYRAKTKMYIGNEAERQYQRAEQEKARADSLQRKLDSLNVTVKVKWEGGQ